MSKQKQLLNQLNAGKTFTADQIAKSFGLAHPASAIRNLRDLGYCVYSNNVTVDGVKIAEYRIGSPTRSIVATAKRLGGASVFTN
jgi:hypothetical protein